MHAGKNEKNHEKCATNPEHATDNVDEAKNDNQSIHANLSRFKGFSGNTTILTERHYFEELYVLSDVSFQSKHSKRPTARVTRWWVGRGNETLPEPASSPETA